MSENIKSKPTTASQHQIQFNNYLVEFIQKLREILPEDDQFKRSLNKYYNYYKKRTEKGERVEFIHEFVGYVAKYSKEISTFDENLFSEEPSYYPGKPIQLMKGLDFKLLWKLESLTDKSKESIWRYLRTLYIIGTYVLKETDRYSDLLKKQKQIIQSITQSLKLEQKIKDEAARLDEEERKALEASGFNLGSLQELFGENNIITEMAIEIAKDLNLSQDTFSNPLDAIRVLFGQDGNKLQDIVVKVGNKLQEKIAAGRISEEQLFGDAKRMNEKLSSKFKGIPGMPDIEKFSQKVAEQIQKKMGDKSANGENGPQMPSMEELTKHLYENLSEMGFENVDQLQSNFSQIMSNIGSNVEVPNHLNTNEPTENNQTGDTNEPYQSLQNDQALQEELDELRKSIN